MDARCYKIYASVVYRTEKAAIGTLHTYRWQRNNDDGTAVEPQKFSTYIGDVWGEAPDWAIDPPGTAFTSAGPPAGVKPL